MSYLDSDALAKLLLDAARPNTLFVPNRGNAGDSLIGEGIFQFFESIGFRYGDASLTDVLDQPSRVVIAGGGNLVLPYHNIRIFLERNFDRFEDVIILPHTIMGHEDLLARMDERFTLICRERRSLEFCQKHAKGARIFHAHDMAFFWDRADTLSYARSAAIRNIGDLRFDVRNLKHIFRFIQHRDKVKDGILNVFREDVEKPDRPVPPNSVDLSHALATDSTDRPYAACAVVALMKFIGRAELVRTDRLHIAILSTLMGKKVEMYDNSYGKNRAIYEYSLAGRYANVRFVD